MRAVCQRPSVKPEWAQAVARASYIAQVEAEEREGGGRRARARGLPLSGKLGAGTTILQGQRKQCCLLSNCSCPTKPTTPSFSEFPKCDNIPVFSGVVNISVLLRKVP